LSVGDTDISAPYCRYVNSTIHLTTYISFRG
jgi:hypothetical protein